MVFERRISSLNGSTISPDRNRQFLSIPYRNRSIVSHPGYNVTRYLPLSDHIGQLPMDIMVLRAMAEVFPLASIPMACLKIIYSHLMLPTSRAASRWIETSLEKPLLVLAAECKSLGTLYTKKHLIIHHCLPFRVLNSAPRQHRGVRRVDR